MSGGDQEAVTETYIRNSAFTPEMHVEKRSTEEQIQDELKVIVKTAFFTSLVHPFNFSQVLMQIGYEPLPARMSTDITGRPVYYLASVFDYIQHIKKNTGLSGLFVGLGPTLAVTIGGIYAYKGAEKIVKYIYDEQYLGRPANFEIRRFGFLEPAERSRNAVNSLRFAPRELVGVTYTVSNFVEDIVKEITIVSASMALTWPLQVVAFRAMAQFVGGESIYNGVASSLQEIVDTEGVAGLFKGLVPMWCSYVAVTTITYTVVFGYACYDNRNPINLKIVAAAAGAVANSFFYPLKLTARLFAIGGARLVAARPPRMPIFTEWRHLHNYLLASGESKRGSSMLFRKAVSKAPGMFDNVEHGASSLYKMSSNCVPDDWSRRYTSTQLLALEGHHRRTNFRLNF